MCRSIKPLFNYDPPATKTEIHEASLQFVRKISGFTKPSKTNENTFNQAIENIEPVIRKLISDLKTNTKVKHRI